MGNYMNIILHFNQELNLNDAIRTLFNDVLKDFYIPVATHYRLGLTNSEVEQGYIDIVDEGAIKGMEILSKEERIGKTNYTRYMSDSIVENILNLTTKGRIIEGPLATIGNLNIYYQRESEIVRDLFFREVYAEDGARYFLDILKVGTFNDKKIKSFNFSTSSMIWLEKWENGRYKKTADLNLNQLVEKIKPFANKFSEHLTETFVYLEGSPYGNESDRIRERVEQLPKFTGFG